MPGRAFSSSSLAVLRSSGAFLSDFVSVLAAAGLGSVFIWALTGAARAEAANSRPTMSATMRVIGQSSSGYSSRVVVEPKLHCCHPTTSTGPSRALASAVARARLVGQAAQRDADRALTARPHHAQVDLGAWR